MKRLMIAGVIGGFVLFIWGWLAWAVLPIHSNTIGSLTSEESVVAALQGSATPEGVYAIPSMPQGSAQHDEAAMNEWMQKHQRGPVAMLIYQPRGMDPMMVSQMITGLIISILSAWLAAWFLSRSTAAAASFIQRVAFFGMLGLFASMVVHLMYWNWLYFPMNYTTAMVADSIISWLLAGLAMSAYLKPPVSQAA